MLLFYNVGWIMAVWGVRARGSRLLTDAATVLAVYVPLAYVVVYVRELRHFLPLAIVVIPATVFEIRRRFPAGPSTS